MAVSGNCIKSANRKFAPNKGVPRYLPHNALSILFVTINSYAFVYTIPLAVYSAL